MNGQELRKMRKNLDLTQTQMADLCGVSMRTFQLWEAAECLPARAELILGKIVGGDAVNAHKVAQKAKEINAASSDDFGKKIADIVTRAFDEIEAQRRLTEKAQAQIDKLIDVIASNK